MSSKLLRLSFRCCCCKFQCRHSCHCNCALHNKSLTNMDIQDDAGGIEAVPSESKEKTRGRSKKKGRRKRRLSARGSFSRIAPGILPSAAIASASPNAVNYIGKSRSPSPLAIAITFAGRVGHMIAAGERLERSLSERDISRRSQLDLTQSKRISKSLPGPSAFQEEASAFAEVESEDGYEVVGDVRNKALAMISSQEDDDAGSVGEREELPLPDEEDGPKEEAKDVDGLYAKVVKHTTVLSRTEELLNRGELVEDSDDLTTVSEEDVETLSKISFLKARLRHQSLPSDDLSDSPSDGEVYRLPMDSVSKEDHLGKRFETIEELENEDLSPSYRHGMVSPTSARSKGSSHTSLGRPASHRSASAHMDGEQSTEDSKPETPQVFFSRSSTPSEMGREAALQRLEELGFDGMSREFGIFPPSEQESKENFILNRKPGSSSEERVLPTFSNIDESMPSFESIDQIQGYEIPEGRASLLRYDETKSKKVPSQRKVIEEPLLQSTAVAQQQSSQELMLEELVDERQSSGLLNGSFSHDATKDSSTTDGPVKSASLSPIEFKQRDSLVTSSTIDKESERRSQSPVSQRHQIMRDKASGRGDSEERIRKTRSTSVSPRQSNDIAGHSGGSPRRHDSGTSQKQIQEEIKQKQDRIMSTINALQQQFDTIAKSVVSEKKDTEDQEEKLVLLRKLIKEEQKNYYEQQKILEEQQQKFLRAQQLISPRSKRSSTPILHHQQSSSRRPRSPSKGEPSDQFRLLENRLKSVEAERNALFDLNSSLQDENSTLKKLAHSTGIGGNDPSGIVFQKQNDALIEDNKNLKSLVHRLNIELSRYQAKYRPPRREEVDGLSLPEEGPVPEWLVNMNYLSPLIMAYDDTLRDKNEVIRAYETNLDSIKTRMNEIVRENQRLHLMNTEKSDTEDAVDLNEWNLLQEHAKLVVEENTILMQEIDLKDRKIDEMQEDFDMQIDKLTKKIMLLTNEKRKAERSISSLQVDNEISKKRCKEAELESSKKISKEEAARQIEEVRRALTEKMESFEKDKEGSETQFQAVLKAKQELAVKLTDSNGRCSQLQLELDLATKSLRKMEKKFIALQNRLEETREKEIVAIDTLARVLSVAEKSSIERDEFAKVIESQNNETMMNYKQILEEEKKLEYLRKELEKYKKLAKNSAAEAILRVKEKDEEIANLQNKYNEEISYLRDVIRDRQMMVDRYQTDNRQFESEIDVLWKSITEENDGFKSLSK